MVKNNENEISPEELTKLYLSMSLKERDLFWKLFSEELRKYRENENNSDKEDK